MIDNLLHNTKDVGAQAAELDIFAWVLIISGPLMLMLGLLKLLMRFNILRSGKIKSAVDFMLKKLIWNFVIRYTITAYLKFAVEFVVNLKQETGGFLMSLKLLLFLFCAVYPFHMLAALEANIESLEKPEVIRKYGSVYMGIKIKPLPLTYSTVFCYRRLLLASSLFLEYPFLGMQLPIFIFVQLYYMCYLIEVRPHEEWFQNRLEFVGECLIMFLAWLMTAFNASNTPE